jgi:uncharacterized protein YyaL (SSP411 family)
MAAIFCDRMYGLTRNRLCHDWAEKTLEAFAKIAPQLALFAASYGLTSVLHARHTLHVVVTGAAAELERAANGVYRFRKSVLRVTPERTAKSAQLSALLTHVDAAAATP